MKQQQQPEPQRRPHPDSSGPAAAAWRWCTRAAQQSPGRGISTVVAKSTRPGLEPGPRRPCTAVRSLQCARRNAVHARLLRPMRNMEGASAGAAGEAASPPCKPAPRVHAAGRIASAATTDHTAIHAERRDVAAAERRLMVTAPGGCRRLGRRISRKLDGTASQIDVTLRRAPPQALWHQNQRGYHRGRRDNPARAIDPP